MNTHVSTIPTAAHGVAKKLAAMRTRCAELEAELEADRATLDDTRAELEACREALVMISSAARCASDTPDDIVEAIRVDTDALRRLRAYRDRVEAAGRHSRGQS